MELHDHTSFSNFFTKNKTLVAEKFASVNNRFKKSFNSILKKAILQKNRTKNQGVGLILYLRTIKYLFTIQELTLEGHLEEARILRRNVIEIIVLAYLVEHSEEVFKLWEECFESRVKNTNSRGVVDVSQLRQKKYEIDQIINKNKSILNQNPVAASLIRLRGEFSTYFSHENIYNIVSRIEDVSTNGLGKLEVYIGQSVESKNNRLHRSLMQNMKLLKIVNELVK